MDVKEWEGRIIFLHAVKPGASDESYGIHVARLAGVPEGVLARAEGILAALTAGDERLNAGAALRPSGWSVAADLPAAANRQLSLFTDGERDALEALRGLDLEQISPVDAFVWLARIKKQLDA
jgi:DNA mismatch repair protein MutS